MPVAVVYAQPPAQRSSARWISFVGAAFGIFGAIVALTGFFLLPSVTVFGVSLNAPQVVTLSPSPLAGLLWLVPIVSFITFLTSNVGWLVGTVNIAPHVAAGLFNMLAAGGVVLLLILDYAAEGYAQFFIGSGFWVMVAGMALVVFGGLLELVGALRAD